MKLTHQPQAQARGFGVEEPIDTKLSLVLAFFAPKGRRIVATGGAKRNPW